MNANKQKENSLFLKKSNVEKINKKFEDDILVKFDNKIISVFATTNKSKVILARQFSMMTKREILEHSSLFSRYLEKEGSYEKNNFDVSISEYEKSDKIISGYRYNYQTLYSKTIYLVLVTVNSFNYFQSLEILKIIHRCIYDLCNLSSINEYLKNESEIETRIINEIKMNAYDIILAIDDVVNPINGKDENNFSRVKLNLKMESIEEKEFTILQKEKESKQRENIVRGIEEIERLKRENKYIENSVSSEEVEQRTTLMNSIVSSINNMREDMGVRQPRGGLNLKDRLIHRIVHQRQDYQEVGKNSYTVI